MRRMFGVVVAAAAAGMAAGCNEHTAGATQSAATVHKPITLTAAQRGLIEKAVRATLKDPDSAKFGDIRAGVSGTGSTNVCGLVNAKNSFGGYVGQQPFTATLTTPDRVEHVVMDSPADSFKLAKLSCENIAPGLVP